jgi:hypothetical protein
VRSPRKPRTILVVRSAVGLVVLGAMLGLFAGCSLPRGAIVTSDAQSGFDAGTGELDAWSPPGEDTGTERDAAPPLIDAFVRGDASGPPHDAGPPCMPHCDGNTLVGCVGGVETPMPCGTSSFCDPSGTPRCRPNVCTPSAVACSADTTSVEQCNASGTAATTTHCDRGCVAGACRAELACGGGLVVAGTIAMSGTTTYDVCGEGDDNNDAHTDPDCPTNGPNGEDVILRFDVDRTRTYRIVARDADTGPVDPCIYLRSACDMRSTEIDCDDDGAGTAIDAQLDIVLTPGEYFLIVDTFEWDDGATHYRCGQVAVDVSAS